MPKNKSSYTRQKTSLHTHAKKTSLHTHAKKQVFIHTPTNKSSNTCQKQEKKCLKSDCMCGSKFLIKNNGEYYHKKTKKHIEFLENLNI